MQAKGWQRDEYRDRLNGQLVAVEIIPVDDLLPHVSNSECACLPETGFQGTAKILVHSAFDGREFLERDSVTNH